MKIALQEAREGRGHSPQLLRELLEVRRFLKPSKDTGSVRGMLAELRELKNTLRGSVERSNSRAAAELLIVNNSMQHLQRIVDEQIKVAKALDKEVELFKDTMNLRLEYYRQLQAISDTVAPFEDEMTDESRQKFLSEKEAAEQRLKDRIKTLRSKGRYLMHLKDEANNAESQRICAICQDPIENGILTTCGHSYCVECLRFWWTPHRNCPQCKQHLSRNDFHQIT